MGVIAVRLHVPHEEEDLRLEVPTLAADRVHVPAKKANELFILENEEVIKFCNYGQLKILEMLHKSLRIF